jgi:hypothetical protein
MEKVPCPGCKRETFPAVSGSECYCSCGTAFRISENGSAIRVERDSPAEEAPGARVRSFFSSREKKPRLA